MTVSGSRIVAIEPQDGETTGIFVSSDKGDSWSQIRDPKGLASAHLNAITGVAGDDRVLLAGSAHQLYKSVDGGHLWKATPVRLVTPPPATPVEKPAPKPARGRTSARARTARPVKPKPNIHEISPEFNGLYSTKNNAKEVILAATDLGLLKSEDLGEQWTLAAIPAATTFTALYLSPNSDGNFMARTSAGLFLTKDYGEHWSPVAFPLAPADVYDIAMPADATCPIFAATRLGLYSSTDDGATWMANVGGIPASTVSTVLYKSAMNAYAVEYGQLYETSDAGKSWKAVPTSLKSTRIRRLWMPDSKSDRLYGITADLGIIFRK